MEKITSFKNPKIKNIINLHKANERKKQNLFVIEGYKEIKAALRNKVEIDSTFYCSEIASDSHLTELLRLGLDVQNVFEITKEIFERIAYRDNSDGLVVLATPRYLKLDDIVLCDNPIILVLESVEKPGNLGAILRTADAVNVDAVIVCDTKTDLFNPNTIRASIGCIFSKQVVVADSKSTFNWLQKKGIHVYSTFLNTNNCYFDMDYTTPTAIVLGTESTGLSQFWQTASESLIKIPMLGLVDSLNVSIAGAVVVFEILRQRQARV